MKRIKELNLVVYEIQDLKGEALQKASDSFIEECLELTGTDQAYGLSQEELIEAIIENDYFYDKFGNTIPMVVTGDSEDENLASLSVSNYLYATVTLEDLKEG